METRMSITRQAAELIKKRGHGTVDDILADMQGCSRAQVLRALRYAAALDLIECDGITPSRGIGNGTGSLPATYRAIKRRAAPAASVWQYAVQ